LIEHTDVVGVVAGSRPQGSTPAARITGDPQRLEKYRCTEGAVAKYREFARKIYANYLLDRPRRTNQSGWPKFDKPERFDRHAWPYQVSGVLGAEEGQDVDMELNR